MRIAFILSLLATSGAAQATTANRSLHGPIAGKRTTYESSPPFPRFRFQYPAEYSVIGYDIGAVMFGRPEEGRNAKLVFTIGTIPTDVASIRDEAARRHLTLLPRTRHISGYEAVKMAPAGTDPSPKWMFITKPMRFLPSSEDTIRFLIVLPDDEGILSSFRLLD
ncbi:MAG: hypothetical protein E6J70_06860 [Deltaproteobacteria bacterium]|nr:MAG: hypothetical protein E6J70_06860 [Deltaproteobacteria bacterium]